MLNKGARKRDLELPERHMYLLSLVLVVTLMFMSQRQNFQDPELAPPVTRSPEQNDRSF